ncbi:MAG: hypothetical protein P1V36_02135 [Planctomycetota bacterium]|nr:hypothetical protein [Planctomycetota bacterium]
MRTPRLLTTLGMVLLFLVPACGGGSTTPPTVAGPAIQDMNPAKGSTLGGYPAVSTAPGFRAGGANLVTIGGTSAPGVVRVPDPRIECAVPPGTVGGADVRVQNDAGGHTRADFFTYIPARFDLRLNTDPVGMDFAELTDVCCSGDVIYAVWSDYRNTTGGGPDVYFNRSLDGGTTWLASDVRVNQDAAGSAYHGNARLCCAGMTVYVVWEDGRTPPPPNTGVSRDIYFNRSDDGGLTWLAQDVRLDSGVAGAVNSVWPDICCQGTDLHVVWREDDTNGVHYRGSLDGGTTWTAGGSVKLDTGPAGGGTTDWPRICCSVDGVYVAWTESGNGNVDIAFNRSLDRGVNWLAQALRLDRRPAAGASRFGEGYTGGICCDGLNVHVVYADDRDGSGKDESDIYLQSSVDGGTTWLVNDVRVNRGTPGTQELMRADVCCRGPAVHVVWRNATVNSSVEANSSSDGGATFLAQDRVLAGPNPEATGARVACLPDGRVLAVFNQAGAQLVQSSDGGVTWGSAVPCSANQTRFSGHLRVDCGRVLIGLGDGVDTFLTLFDQ